MRPQSCPHSNLQKIESDFFTKMFYRETHQNLHDGSGFVTTYTCAVRELRGRTMMKIIFLKLTPYAEIGLHEHNEDSEIYITLNSKVLFSNNVKWRMCHRCRIGNSHSAKNTSSKKATIFAIKY